MKSIIHKADSRGHADHGWLNSYHSFSFAQYYNKERIHFGRLRVLNDDTLAPAMGFGKHPHDNMEIISIPLEGALEHGDNTGVKAIIRKGDIQVMSAGTGIVHSEKNASNDSVVKFLQIWVMPNKQNVTPRYDQRTFYQKDRQNKLVLVVSPMGETEGVNIYQDAWFSLGSLDAHQSLTYTLKRKGNGVYAFILQGAATINDIELNSRDGTGITQTDSFDIKATTAMEILLIDVPMD
ncbi:MAG: pirin family protein [Flavisolibacter sp.]